MPAIPAFHGLRARCAGRTLASSTLAWLLLASAPPALAQWTTSQGGTPRRDGFVDTQGPSAPEPGWSVKRVTQFPIHPVVGEGLVVTARVFDWTSPTGTALEAFELRTGRRRWTTTLPSGPAPGGLYSAPLAIRDGRVYATRLHWGLVNESLYALSAATGAQLWKGEDAIQVHHQSSPAFLANGDLVLNGRYVPGKGWKLHRVDQHDGKTLWRRPAGEGTNALLAGGAVFQDRFYLVDELPGQHRIVRVNVDTGLRLYASAAEGDGVLSTAANNVLVDPQGRLYWAYGGGSSPSELIALDDTGSGFVEAWRRAIHALHVSSLAVGPDGSVYAISTANEVLRLDRHSGAVRDRSAPLSLEVLTARMAVDREGRLFVVATGLGAVHAELHAYEADLRSLWSRDLGVAPVSGPSLSEDGRLVVSTASGVLTTFGPDHHDETFPACLLPASATLRNGAGTNPTCFASAGPPVLGATWVCQIDTNVRPGPAFFGFLFTAQPASGLFVPGGEVLVDLASPRHAFLLTPTTGGAGGVETVRIPLPRQQGLCGVQSYGQAFVTGGGGISLCNALDLVLGG